MNRSANPPKTVSTPSIFFDQHSQNARRILLELDITLAHSPSEADMLWIRKNYRSYYPTLTQTQLINHIPHEAELTDKGKLALNLHRYSKNKNNRCNLADFYPETYCLFDETERERFISRFQNKKDPGLWVLKPATLSKGRGIKIIRSTDEAMQHVLHQAPIKGVGSRINRIPYLIQRHINNPLLLNERKSELRVYLLIASLNPLKAYVYPQGPVRLCSLPFDENNLDNKLIHITNIFQQHKHPNFKEDTTLKWSFDTLNQDLYKRGLSQSKDAMHSVVFPAIISLLRHTIQSALPSLTQVDTPANYFGLYGVDLILDNNLQPWLTEVQIGPGLSFIDPVKKQVIFDMLQEAATICFDIQSKKRQSKNPLPITTKTQFIELF